MYSEEAGGENKPKQEESSRDVIYCYENDALQEQKEGRRSRGRWTLEEQAAYLDFMKVNREDFLQQYYRRSRKIFERMSNMKNISRGGQQCRSHHQKMCLKTKTGGIDEVIDLVQKRVNKKKTNLHIECQYDKKGHSMVSIFDYSYIPMGKIELYKKQSVNNINVKLDLDFLETY